MMGVAISNLEITTAAFCRHGKSSTRSWGKGVAFFATTTFPKLPGNFEDAAELVKKSYRFGDTEQFGGVTKMAHNRFQTGNSSLFELVTKLHQFRV